MRIALPPSSRNALLGCLTCTVSVAPFATSGGFPRVWDVTPGGFPRNALALCLPAAIRARSIYWKYD
eukprot:6362079-Pyramimonas_sp.AAC.1